MTRVRPWTYRTSYGTASSTLSVGATKAGQKEHKNPAGDPAGCDLRGQAAGLRARSLQPHLIFHLLWSVRLPEIYLPPLVSKLICERPEHGVGPRVISTARCRLNKAKLP